MPEMSVIVPVLNEEGTLPELFDALDAQREVDLQVIVADGGSSDASRAVAESRGARVVASRKGRGAQMNAGANMADADWLLFLHADSRPMCADQLSRALNIMRNKPSYSAGHFGLRFVGEKTDTFLYRYMEAKTKTNRPYTINGDQGLLISREWFRELGGFDTSLPFLEDQRIARTIRENGAWVPLSGRLETSARRFESEGSYRRYLLMAVIMLMHAAEERGFLQKTPTLYRVQDDTKKLLLTPYFSALKQYFASRSLRKRIRAWLRIGDFVVKQTWQAGFILDVSLRRILRGRRPFSFACDKLISPFLQRTGHIWAALFTHVALFYILRPLFRVWERGDLDA
jgi:rSAM/selenodomain-associated transferase 2